MPDYVPTKRELALDSECSASSLAAKLPQCCKRPERQALGTVRISWWAQPCSAALLMHQWLALNEIHPKLTCLRAACDAMDGPGSTCFYQLYGNGTAAKSL